MSQRADRERDWFWERLGLVRSGAAGLAWLGIVLLALLLVGGVLVAPFYQ